jgi:hypothetical protein
MAQRLDAREPGFAGAFNALLSMKREISEDVDQAVRAIIDAVVARGDAALMEYTARFDGLDLTPATLRVGDAEIDAAEAACTREALDALRLARERIEVYHRAQRPEDATTTDALGVTLGWRWTALESVGLYVPGGTASYPSSVLMNAVPAKVAGVPRVVMVVPTPRGETNPLVLAAARFAGVDEVYRVGGAQAVAALAYGTATIAPVAKIVGPGNAYVAAAKRRVFGQVGIDMIAGPSEVLILADGHANPDWVAADLLAQAEHDTASPGYPCDRQQRSRRRGGGCRRAPTRHPAAHGHRLRELARFWRGSSWLNASPTRSRSSIVWPPSTWRSSARIPRRSPPASGMRARSFSAAIPRKPSAITSAGRTTCFQRRVRRGSPRGSACLTFMKRPRS